MFTYLSAGGSLLVVRVELVQSVKHLSDHVVQDASVAEVHQLHISVKAGLGLEGAPVVQLHVHHLTRTKLLWQSD